jgi:hypothetical protein
MCLLVPYLLIGIPIKIPHRQISTKLEIKRVSGLLFFDPYFPISYVFPPRTDGNEKKENAKPYWNSLGFIKKPINQIELIRYGKRAISQNAYRQML